MRTRAITVHPPEEAVKELEQTAKRKLKLDDMLVYLIEESLRRERGKEAVEKRPAKIAELTTAYLSGRLERKGSINEISFDPEVMEKAAMKTFGTTDITRIIEMVRRYA
jgi:hypothetical protein